MLDLETAIISALVDENTLDGNLSGKLPKDFATKVPYGTLRRAPGSRYIDTNTKRLEVVRLQANIWGEMDEEVATFEAMKGLIDAIVSLEGTAVGGMFVTAVDVPQTPQWSPDPETERPGYLSFVMVYAHG